MNAKNTNDAAASTPYRPKEDGAAPVNSCSSGCSRPDLLPAGDGSLGGMKGERLLALK